MLIEHQQNGWRLLGENHQGETDDVTEYSFECSRNGVFSVTGVSVSVSGDYCLSIGGVFVGYPLSIF